MKKLLTLCAAVLTSVGMWAAASTTSDGKYATGIVDFSSIGTLDATTTYWHNGVKFYSGNSTDVNASTSSWSEKISIPAYIANKTASNTANKGKWGKNGTGKQYTMSGFACSQHTIGIHVNQACTLTVVVNKNRQSDTDDANITASLDATPYNTAWSSSTYKAAGTALTVSSTRADATNAPGRYTLTIVVANNDLTDGEAVVKMFNGSSGTGADKLFCWESITVTPATSYTITYDANGGEGEMENSTNTISVCTFTAPDGYEFKEWNTAADGKGTSYAAGATATSDLDLYAIWQVHATSSDATLSALSVAGCTLSPAFASGTTAYTIALPFYASMPAVGDVTATKNDSYAKDPVVSIADNVISIACEAEDGTKKTYTVTVNIAEIPAASTSINIEQLVLDNSKSYSYTTALTAANISYANLNGLDSLAIGDSKNSRPDYNEPFLGLKIKKSGGYIQMVIPAGKTLKVKFGSIAANLKLTINEVAQSDISKSTSVYEHTATGNELIKIATSSDGTVVLKQIMIDEDIAVVRPFEANIAATTNGTASVELEKYAKGEEVTVNCVPASGYKLASIAVSGYNDKGAETDVTVTGNKFTMPGSPVTITVTFSIATSISNTSDAAKSQKRIENGQLVIEKNGQVFNAMGQTIR